MVEQCRQAIPDVTITTDVMVGFPGETEDDFDEGREFIRAMAFDGMHVFKYSRRPGTRAARLPEQVAEESKAERSRLLRDEALAGVARLLGRHRGRVAGVVWESELDGISRGLTDTNVRAYGPAPHALGSLIRMRLNGAFRDGLWAEPADTDLVLFPV